MLAVYALSMLLYFRFRKKYAETKYVVELFFIVLAALISVAVKAALIFVNSADSFTTGFAGIVHALYSGFGGLAFEGLDGLTEIESSLLQCLYTCSSLYAGLMFVSVITAKANYEIYSGLRLLALRLRLRTSAKYAADNDLYIFTSVTEDCLILAESIERKYVSDKRRCVIIFTGEDLDAFDRKDPLHRIIMSKGYIYWPFFKSKENSRNSSVLKRLGLFIDNGFFGEDYLIDNAEAERFKIEAVSEFLLKALDYARTVDNKKAAEFVSSLVNEWERKYGLRFPNFDKKNPEKSFLALANSCSAEKGYKNLFLCAPYNEDDFLNKDAYSLKKKCVAPVSRVHFFALGYNEKLSGLECENSAAVFDEIACLSKEYRKSKKKTVVDFYILTDNEINYAYYQKEVGEVLKSAVGEEAEKYSRYFQMHVINEAVMAGKCLDEARAEVFIASEREGEESLFVSDSVPNKDNTYRTLVLGFGKTGQHAMKTVFTDTSYVDENGVPSKFIADVYDAAAEERAGIFAMTHPMFICNGKGEDKIRMAFSEKTIKKLSAEGQITDFDGVKKYLQLPEINFHGASCFDLPFLEYLDKLTGMETVGAETAYNAFIIALGDDEKNITMGNALIDDIKHEYSYVPKNEDVFPQIIYINIRDERNYDRINWSEEDAAQFPKTKVVKFGNRQRMYSFEQIIDDSSDALYNGGYDSVTGSEGAEAFEIVREAILHPEINAEKDYSEYLKSILKKLAGLDPLRSREKWLSVPMFKKESNSAANRFRIYFEKRLAGQEKITGKELLICAQIEHVRWNRFHIANGWTFVDYDRTGEPGYNRKAEKKIRESRKEHDCICPFNMINVYTATYDIVNVAMGYKGLR